MRSRAYVNDRLETVTPGINQLVDDKVRNVSEKIWSQLGGPGRALVLAGSFGRGDGFAWVEDGGVRLQNDLDFELVFKSRGVGFAKAVLKRSNVEEDLRGLDWVKQVDIGVKHLPSFSKSGRIAWTDMLACLPPIVGDPRMLDALTEVGATGSSELLDATEGLRLVLNRGGGLVLSCLQLLLPGGSADRQKNIEIEISKAALAAGDLRILRRGLYAARCEERGEELKTVLESGDDALGEWYRSALEFKLFGAPFFRGRTPEVSWGLAYEFLVREWGGYSGVPDWENSAPGHVLRHKAVLETPRTTAVHWDLPRIILRSGADLGVKGEMLRRGMEPVLLRELAALLPVCATALSVPEDPSPAVLARMAGFLRAWHPGGEVRDALTRLTATV